MKKGGRGREREGEDISSKQFINFFDSYVYQMNKKTNSLVLKGFFFFEGSRCLL